MNVKSLLLLLAACSVSLSSCGYKGRLKTPSQVEQERAKKEAKQKQKAEEAQSAPVQETE
jgi:predicted small lipoprotein YifL